jgi:leader peptidase (prepilin peptidase)/N-methyltransferase
MPSVATPPAQPSDAPAAGAKPTAADRLRSPAVIVGTVVLAGAVAAAQSSLANSVLRAALVFVLVPCALIDIERRVIPNRITGPAALIAIVLGLALDPAGEPKRLMWAAIAGGFLLVASLINPAGMGMGDVKLLGVMGLFLGRPVIVALFLALIGSVFAAAAIASRHGVRAARKTGLPFGPYLAMGGVLAAFLGDPILHAYLSLGH